MKRFLKPIMKNVLRFPCSNALQWLNNDDNKMHVVSVYFIKKICIDVDVMPETVTEENVVSAAEAPKEEAPIIVAAQDDTVKAKEAS